MKRSSREMKICLWQGMINVVNGITKYSLNVVNGITKYSKIPSPVFANKSNE